MSLLVKEEHEVWVSSYMYRQGVLLSIIPLKEETISILYLICSCPRYLKNIYFIVTSVIICNDTIIEGETQM